MSFLVYLSAVENACISPNQYLFSGSIMSKKLVEKSSAVRSHCYTKKKTLVLYLLSVAGDLIQLLCQSPNSRFSPLRKREISLTFMGPPAERRPRRYINTSLRRSAKVMRPIESKMGCFKP